MSGTSDHPDGAADGDRVDWEGRHARTNPPSAGRDADAASPPVQIEWDPEDGEWDVRHAHVRRLADE